MWNGKGHFGPVRRERLGVHSVITGAHILLFSEDSEADRVFIRDVLGFPSVDAGHGWLIFRLPPAEIAVHPMNGDSGEARERSGKLRSELYLMCDDVASVIGSLQAKGIECSEINDTGWGMLTSVRLPSGGEVGLYEPKHATALELE